MTRAHSHRGFIGFLAIVIAVALALSATTAPASSRTFDFNSTGSMVQAPLSPQWGCIMRHLLSGETRNFRCR